MKSYLYKYIIIIAGTVLLSGKSGMSEEVGLTNLRCEMLVNPEGIDLLNPRLSWEISSNKRNTLQTAYQVIVASTPEKLAAGEGDLWNSGIVKSSQSVHVSYDGASLKSRTNCYWKVKVWSNNGESDWSRPAYWSMGLLYYADWKGRWIGLDSSFPWDSEEKFSRLSARYFRKEFKVSGKIKQAMVYIIGLGLYELYINGQRIGNHVLAPTPTDYTKSVKYNAFDVTETLTRGKNTIATVLGNGRYYTMRQAFKSYKIKTFGYPKMLLQLEIKYADGTNKVISTDNSWKVTADGPIRSNNEYDGEEYEATKEMPGWNSNGFNDRKWLNAEYVQEPGGTYKAQMNDNMKVMDIVKPVTITLIERGTYILDMGQNMVGWLKMRVQGEKGEQVTLRFAETLKKNGELYTANLRDAKVTDVYTIKSDGEEIWEPSFVYHGFRYVEIKGYPGIPRIDDFEGRVVYDDIRTVGTFKTSNRIINRIYKNAFWGIRGNYKGMPLDCPQRNERQPWLGDRVTGSGGETFIFDNGRLYSKWLDDIHESQKADGSLPNVAPAYWNYYDDNMTWPGAYIIIANMLYNQFGDKQSIVRHYDSMKKWLDYMRTKYMVDFILTKDKYGDWCVPPELPRLVHSKDPGRKTDGELIATAYCYHLLYLMKRFAKMIGRPQDVQEYNILLTEIKDAFNKKFLNKENLQYSNNTVTANLLPLYFGMVPEKHHEGVFNNIVNIILEKNKGHISTGLVGVQWLMRGLTENGRQDVAYKLATNRGYPSWGYMAENGATTIWELWNGNTADPSMNSHNHVMLLGDLIIWFYENLAGIKTDPSHPGFKQIEMKPCVIEELDFVEASYHSVHGLIKSCWKKDNSRFIWNITIPGNTKALVYIPARSESSVTEGGNKADAATGVRFIRMEGDRAVFEIDSGDYSFLSDSPEKRWKKGIITDEFIFEKAPFKSCHASTIAETNQDLIAAWFGGTKERNPDVGIWISHRKKERWTEPVEVANGIVNDSTRFACWNPVLYQVPGGDLLLFFKVGPSPSQWKGMLISSSDGGTTWSVPRALPEGYIGPVKNKPVLLENGNLLSGSSTEGSGWIIHFEITPDFGKTWKKVGPVNNRNIYEAIQPAILVHKIGSLQALCRSRNRAIVESWSTDNGLTWSALQETSLPNNNSGIDAVTLADGRHLLVYNHLKPPEGKSKGARTPLNAAVSEDGKTWYATLVLEDSPVSRYSYPSVIQSSDGLVHVVYTWRRERIKHVVIDPSKLELEKIINEQWP